MVASQPCTLKCRFGSSSKTEEQCLGERLCCFQSCNSTHLLYLVDHWSCSNYNGVVFTVIWHYDKRKFRQGQPLYLIRLQQNAAFMDITGSSGLNALKRYQVLTC